MNKTGSRPRRLIRSTPKESNTSLPLVPHPPKSIPAILISKNSTSVDSDSDPTLSLKASADELTPNEVQEDGYSNDTEDEEARNHTQIRARTYNVTKKPHRRVTWGTTNGDENVHSEESVSKGNDAIKNSGRHDGVSGSKMDLLSPNDYTGTYFLDLNKDSDSEDDIDDEDQETPLSTQSDLTHESSHTATIKTFSSGRSAISSKKTQAMIASGQTDETSPKRTKNASQTLLGLRKEDTFVVKDWRSKGGTVSPSEDLRRRKAMALAKANARHLLKKRSDHYFYDKSNESHYNFRNRSNSQGSPNQKRAYIENTGKEVINDRGEKISFHWQETQGPTNGRNHHITRGPKAIERLYQYKKKRMRHKHGPVMLTKSAPDEKEPGDHNESQKMSSQIRSKTATLHKHSIENTSDEDGSKLSLTDRPIKDTVIKPEGRHRIKPKEAFVESGSLNSDADLSSQNGISSNEKNPTEKISNKHQLELDKENTKSNKLQTPIRSVALHKFSELHSDASIKNSTSHGEISAYNKGASKSHANHHTNHTKVPHPPPSLEQSKDILKVPSKSKHNIPSKNHSKQQNGTGSSQIAQAGSNNDKPTINVGHHGNRKVGQGSDSNLDLKIVPEKNDRIGTKAASLPNINNAHTDNGLTHTVANPKPVSTATDKDLSTSTGRKPGSNGKTGANLGDRVTLKQDVSGANPLVPDATKVSKGITTDTKPDESHNHGSLTRNNSRGADSLTQPQITRAGNKSISASQNDNANTDILPELNDSAISEINSKVIKPSQKRDNNDRNGNVIAGRVHQQEKQPAWSNTGIDLLHDNTNKTNNITQNRNTQKDIAPNHQRSNKQTLKLTDHEDGSAKNEKLSIGATIGSGILEASNINDIHAKDKIPPTYGVTKTGTKESTEDSKEIIARATEKDRQRKNDSKEINFNSKLVTSSKDFPKNSKTSLLSQKTDAESGFDQNISKLKGQKEHLNNKNKKAQNELGNNSLYKKTIVQNKTGNQQKNQAPTTDQSHGDAPGASRQIDSNAVNKTARRGIINGEPDNKKQFDHMVMRETQQRVTGMEGPGDDPVYSEKGEQTQRDKAVTVPVHQIKENNMDVNNDVKEERGKSEKKESDVAKNETRSSDGEKQLNSEPESTNRLEKENNSSSTGTALMLDKNLDIQKIRSVEYDKGGNISEISSTKKSVQGECIGNEQRDQLNAHKPSKEILKLELTETNKGDIKDTPPPSINRYQTQSSLALSEYNIQSSESSFASANVFTVATEAPYETLCSSKNDGNTKWFTDNSESKSVQLDVDSITGNRGDLISQGSVNSVAVFREWCRSDDINSRVPNVNIGSIGPQGKIIDENSRNEPVIAGGSSGDYGTGNQTGPTEESDLQNAPVKSCPEIEREITDVSRNRSNDVNKQKQSGDFELNDRHATVTTLGGKNVQLSYSDSHKEQAKQQVKNGFQPARSELRELKVYQNTGASYKLKDKKKNKLALTIHAQNIEIPEMQTKSKNVRTSNSNINQGVIYHHNKSSQPNGFNVNSHIDKQEEFTHNKPDTYSKQNIPTIKESEKMNNDVILQKPVLVRPKSAGLSAYAMYESEDLWSVNTGEEDDDHIQFIDGEQDFFKVFGYDEDTAAILMATRVYPIPDDCKETEELETANRYVRTPNPGGSSTNGSVADNNGTSLTKSNNTEVSKDIGVGYNVYTKTSTKKHVIPKANNQSKLTKTAGKQSNESLKNDAVRTHGYQAVTGDPSDRRYEITETKNTSINASVNNPKATQGNNAPPQTKIASLKVGPKNDKRVTEHRDDIPSNKVPPGSKLIEKQQLANQKQGGKGAMDAKSKPQITLASRLQQLPSPPVAAATITLLSEREHVAIQEHVMRRRFHSEADIDTVKPNTIFADAKGQGNASRSNFASHNINNHEEKFGYQKRHLRHKSLAGVTTTATTTTTTTNNNNTNVRHSRESVENIQSTHGSGIADAKQFKGRHFYRQVQHKTNDEPTRLGDKLTPLNSYTHAADRIISRFSDTENAINGRSSNNSSSDNNTSQSPGASSNNNISTISKISTDLYHVTKTPGNAGRRMSHPAESRIAHAHQAEVVLAPKQPRKLKPIIHQSGQPRFNNHFSTGLK